MTLVYNNPIYFIIRDQFNKGSKEGIIGNNRLYTNKGYRLKGIRKFIYTRRDIIFFSLSLNILF